MTRLEQVVRTHFPEIAKRAIPGGARHGEYIRSIDWRRIADPELQREMPQVAVFAASRKGQYYEQARSSAGG
ncbi:MAG: hypothetical protein ACYDA5_04820 [Vulcanimicrobiaceae bacterium]